MTHRIHRLAIDTARQGLVEITTPVVQWVERQELAVGLVTLYCRHTSASLLIQENAAADVRADLETFMRKLVPEGRGLYRHDEEGDDDMPAHIRAALTQTSIAIPVAEGRLLLGRWQGIFLFEHRATPHRREIVLHLAAD